MKRRGENRKERDGAGLPGLEKGMDVISSIPLVRRKCAQETLGTPAMFISIILFDAAWRTRPAVS
jgi:hypothetical protein